MEAVYARAMNLSRNPDAASDLLQDTYLRAFRSFDSFAPGTNCKAWLFRILYTTFVNRFHQSRREPELQDPEAIDRNFAAIVDRESALDEPAGRSIRSWATAEVARSLDALPEAFRTVLLMVEVDELTYEETSALLGCPVGTVRSRLSRARRMLFLELEAYARERRLLLEESAR